VGFLGDGINNAPPLKAAPTSVSVDSAVHIAKELADIILLLGEIRNIDDLMGAVHVFHAAKISEGRPPPLDV
jgi:cation transport ATPase